MSSWGLMLYVECSQFLVRRSYWSFPGIPAPGDRGKVDHDGGHSGRSSLVLLYLLIAIRLHPNHLIHLTIHALWVSIVQLCSTYVRVRQRTKCMRACMNSFRRAGRLECTPPSPRERHRGLYSGRAYYQDRDTQVSSPLGET